MPKQKILIVEDAPDIAGLLQIFFSSKNYEALVATRGAQGLEKARSASPDLILLDVNLPDMNGFQVCDTLRSNLRTKYIPIIFLTARGEKGDKIQGFQKGADDYIVKPFDIEELHMRVERALERASFRSLTNPTTGLPGSKLIEEQLKEILARSDWVLASIGLAYFHPFTEKYGFVAGDNALRFVALFLDEALSKLGGPDDFIGHVGGSDFILTTALDRVHPICDRLIERFDARIGTLYDYRDRKAGYIEVRDEEGESRQVSLMYLIIGVVDGTKRTFSDIRELTEVAAEVRQKARQIKTEGGRIAFG